MFTLNCNGKLLLLDNPQVMGIINLTPDSFFAGSRVEQPDELIRSATSQVRAGATLIDLGGQSTRPGSSHLSPEQEWERVGEPLARLRKAFPQIIISLDTFYSEVAQKAVNAGADIINDISGGQLDPSMLATVGRLKVPYICTHMRGTPQNMQQQAVYEDLVREVMDYFIERLSACRLAGIHDLILDPGFGFAKTISHNFRLLKQLDTFKILEKPILVGLSRKSTIYKTLGIGPDQALNGTTVLHTLALERGAHILRAHDVREALEAVKLWGEFKKA